MPQARISTHRALEAQLRQLDPGPPPPVMTRRKASPVIVLSIFFWLIELFFQWFWLLGPVFIGIGAGAIADNYLGSWAGYVTGAVAGFASGLLGSGSGVFEIFGFFMAMVVGFIGSLVVLTAIAWSDFRLLRENSWGFLGLMIAFCIGELPFLGSAPALPVAVWRMYSTQIAADRSAFAAWQMRQQEFERAQAQALSLRIQEAQGYAEARQAAHDNEAIPEDERAAA